jgi:signal transduction histidine kinase
MFAKLLFGYLVIFALTLAAFTAAMSFIYQGVVFADKEKALARSGAVVNRQINNMYQGALGQEGLDEALYSIGYGMDARIYALEINWEDLASLQASADTSGELARDLISIMQGKEVFRKQKYNRPTDSYMVFYGMPLLVDGIPRGAIIQYSPVEQIRSGLFQVYRQIWAIGAFVAVLSAVVIYLYAARTAKSLRDMERAASRLASGEPVEDLANVGNDELGRLVEVFNDMKRKLERVENIRRDFLAGISHELRTPLTSILGFVQGMSDGLVAEREMPGVLTIIQEETRRMISLTGEILDLAKLENGVGDMFPERFRIFEALIFIVGTLNVKEKKPGLRVEVFCPDDLYVTADTDRFRQIMLNLLSNAIKYTDPPGTIAVRVERQGKWARFGVIDTGVGIDATELPLVFERFYRTDKSRHSGTGGAGLGLNITKVMVEQHGGRIWIESVPGQGTKIWFTLPVDPL